MAGRGAQTFKKRQKEQQRKEKQQEKFAKRIERKLRGPSDPDTDEDLLAELAAGQLDLAEAGEPTLEAPSH